MTKLTPGLFHPLAYRFAEYIRATHAMGFDLARPGELAHLPGIVVTGSGPSLGRYGVLDDIRTFVRNGYGVMACKGSAAVLRSKGIPVHFAVAADSKADQIAKTPFDPQTTYYFSSLCNPGFLQHFRSLGAKIRIFHTEAPIFDPVYKTDAELITALWPDANMIIATGGVSVASRALGLADALVTRRRRLVAAGMDFGWRAGSGYYARGVGSSAGNWGPVFTDHGALDGVPWFSKHDQLVCAEHLAISCIMQGERLTVLGDTIARGFLRRHSDFLMRYRTCWGQVFKRVADPVIPAGGASTKHPPVPAEDVEAALELGYEVPPDVLAAYTAEKSAA